MKPSSSDQRVKVCRVCGRQFSWQKRWEDQWDSVRVCSKACRKKGITKTDKAIEKAIIDCLSDLALPKEKAPGAISPEDIAALLWPTGWSSHLSQVHNACRRLAHQGEIDIFVGKKKIDPSALKGRVVLRLGNKAF